LRCVDRQTSKPDRLSEGEDSFIDEKFFDSKRTGGSDCLAVFCMDFFVDEEEDVVWKRKERSWRLSGFESC